MKRRPKGLKYRYLAMVGRRIYYQRIVNGKMQKFSLKTSDWSEAAAYRDLYESEKQIGRFPFAAKSIPQLEEFAKRYLDEDTGDLAPTTLRERERALSP